jgi:hypothetical protein
MFNSSLPYLPNQQYNFNKCKTEKMLEHKHKLIRSERKSKKIDEKNIDLKENQKQKSHD